MAQLTIVTTHHIMVRKTPTIYSIMNYKTHNNMLWTTINVVK